MESCIYEGRVVHARHGAVEHRFGYSLFMMYLDLDELPELIARHAVLSRAPFAPASFRREDHLDDAAMPLADAVRSRVESETGRRPTGPIRLLTQLRYWGYYFSPLNLFYCFDPSGEHLEAIVAEVSNTPWGERHCYVLCTANLEHREVSRKDPGAGYLNSSGSSPRAAALPPQAPDARLRFRHPKAFHVSPFMGMDAEYLWNLNLPGDRLKVSIESRRGDRAVFRAAMSLARREITGRHLSLTLLSYPAMTVKIIAAIYFEALRLWWKQCPYHPHPPKSEKPRPVLNRTG
ncbi:MAG: DUF1365 domain-containing protein [Thermoguttaceae bacterium]